MEKDKIENIVLKNNVLERTVSDAKYAPMWVKVVLVWVGSIFGGAILLALSRVVIK